MRALMSNELGFIKLGIDLVVLLLFIKSGIELYKGESNLSTEFMIGWAICIVLANLGNVGFILRLISKKKSL